MKTPSGALAFLLTVACAFLTIGPPAFGQGCNKDQVQVKVRKYVRDTPQMWIVKFDVHDSCPEKLLAVTLFINYSYEYRGSDGRVVKSSAQAGGTINPSESHSTVLEEKFVVPEGCEVIDVYVDSVSVVS